MKEEESKSDAKNLASGHLKDLKSNEEEQEEQQDDVVNGLISKLTEEAESDVEMIKEMLRMKRFANTDLLKPERWPTPKWYFAKKAQKMQTYEDHFGFQLRTRYLELETDFRTVLGNFPGNVDVVTAQRIADILRSARDSLQEGTIDLLTVSSSLDLVERNMVWLYPAWLAKARIEGILLRLESMSFKAKDSLKKKLSGLSNAENEADLAQVRSTLDEALGLINAEIVQERIGRGLQINRLKALRLWGVFVLLIFLIATPLATNIKSISDWPSQIIVGQGITAHNWMNALAMMILGAVGGFLSGLLQVRSTRVTLDEYLESMLRLQLRPLVGSLVALILYTILSWQVLPGINIVNAGSYFLIAFLSGFSERYFLRLLKTEPENSNEEGKTFGTPEKATPVKDLFEEKK